MESCGLTRRRRVFTWMVVVTAPSSPSLSIITPATHHEMAICAHQGVIQPLFFYCAAFMYFERSKRGPKHRFHKRVFNFKFECLYVFQHFMKIFSAKMCTFLRGKYRSVVIIRPQKLWPPWPPLCPATLKSK